MSKELKTGRSTRIGHSINDDDARGHATQKFSERQIYFWKFTTL